MAHDHLKNSDPRPKRRRDKDNPYEIFTVGIETDHPHYYIRFMDSLGVEQCMEIEKNLFELFNRFELDDLSFLNEVDNHYGRTGLHGEAVEVYSVAHPESVEETVSRHMEQEALYTAMQRLPKTQYRRLVLYYFGELTYEQIAEMEGCRHQTVRESVCAALKNLKKFLR